MMGLDSVTRHAKDAGRKLPEFGFRKRSGKVYYPGDTVIYGGHAGSSYRGGGSGHIGFYMEVDGQGQLWSYLNGGWQLSSIGNPDEVYYQP